MSERHQESAKQATQNNSDSYTYEDLDEALEDIMSVFELLLKKARQAESMIDSEVEARIVKEPYIFENELKFIVYKLL